MTITNPDVHAVVEEFRSSTEEVEVAYTPPAESYVSSEFYRFEQDAVFAREWICVARQEELPRPGDFVTIDVAGEPVIVVRKRDGELNAMSAVCRHRGACITAPPGLALDDLDAPLADQKGHV